MINRIIISLAAWAFACPVFALNISDYRLVDLTRPFRFARPNTVALTWMRRCTSPRPAWRPSRYRSSA
jgi:hypothetical protein